MENEELIRQDMERTRESLTEKLETLENKVLSSVHQATSAVNETVTSVKESMHEGVEKVKDAVDIKAHVETHPWLMLGGALAAGYALGAMFFNAERRIEQAEPQPSRPQNLWHPGNGDHKKPQQTSEATVSEQPGWLQMLEPELSKLKGLALGVALGTVREAITAELPSHMADQVRQVMDAVTEKVGGAPVSSEDLPFMHQERPAGEAQQDLPSFDAETPRW